MLAALTLSIALAGPSGATDRPRKRPKAAPAAPAGAYVPSGTGVDPTLLPPLTGRSDVLQLEGLKRTSIRFGVSHDGAVLGQLDEAASAVLRRQLAADPTWRLTRLRDTWVATRRDRSGDGWTSGPEGYHLGATCWRVGVRLGPASATYPWSGGGAITVLRDDERENGVWAIAIENPPCRTQRAVAVVAEGQDVAIEVLDAGTGDQALRVEGALGDLPIDLANAAVDADLVARRGFDPSQLGAALPCHPEDPSLRARDGGLEFTAVAHFDRAALCWARVIRDGAAWNEAVVAEATLEAPGWSDDPNDQFLLQSRVPVAVDAPFDATVELWCHPEDGAPARVSEVRSTVGAP